MPLGVQGKWRIGTSSYVFDITSGAAILYAFNSGLSPGFVRSILLNTIVTASPNRHDVIRTTNIGHGPYVYALIPMRLN